MTPATIQPTPQEQETARTIVDLFRENRQLKAEVAKLREAIEFAQLNGLMR